MVLQGTRSLPQRIRAQPTGSRCKAKTSSTERPGGFASYAGEPIPNPNSKAKANEWLDRAGAPYINDYGVLAAGPKWSVLRDFHNLYEKVENDELVITESSGGGVQLCLSRQVSEKHGG